MPEKISDKQRVINYLNRLVSGRLFQIKDLETLTVNDLIYDTPIQDVDRLVIEETLEGFRIKYKSEIFKET